MGAAALLACSAGVWAVSAGPSGDGLTPREQRIVDAVASGEARANPADAALFVERNLDVLLSEHGAEAVGDAALRRLVAAALQDESEQIALLSRVAAVVADQGAIHSDGLPTVFAEAVAANMAWVDQRINAPFMYQAGEVPRDVEAEYLALHDFLRETMRDPDAAGRIREGLHHYGSTETRAAPQSGQARRLRLKQIGRLQRFLFETQRNAERGKSDDELDTDDLAAAQEREEPRRVDDAANRAVWLVTDLYDSDTPAGTSLRTSAHGQPFVDGTGALKSDMSPSELRAFREWASAQTGTDDDRGPIWSDNNALHAGGAEIVTPEHGIHITGRR